MEGNLEPFQEQFEMKSPLMCVQRHVSEPAQHVKTVSFREIDRVLRGISPLRSWMH